MVETPVVVCEFSCIYAVGLQICSITAFNVFWPLNIFNIFFLCDTLLRYIFARTYFYENNFGAFCVDSFLPVRGFDRKIVDLIL